MADNPINHKDWWLVDASLTAALGLSRACGTEAVEKGEGRTGRGGGRWGRGRGDGEGQGNGGATEKIKIEKDGVGVGRRNEEGEGEGGGAIMIFSVVRPSPRGGGREGERENQFFFAKTPPPG